MIRFHWRLCAVCNEEVPAHVTGRVVDHWVGSGREQRYCKGSGKKGWLEEGYELVDKVS